MRATVKARACSGFSKCPYEEGTERDYQEAWFGSRLGFSKCPYEEGTESLYLLNHSPRGFLVSANVPTKRELKAYYNVRVGGPPPVSANVPTKRELKGR